MRAPRSLGLGVGLLACLATAAFTQQAGNQNYREMFLRLDANNDTVIERDEVPESGLAAFDRLVKLGDTDKDGKLSAAEFRALGEKVKAVGPLAGTGLIQRLKAADKDGDGKVSRAEFPGQPPMFNRIDADKDGFLTKEEVGQFARNAQAKAKAKAKRKAKAKADAAKGGDAPEASAASRRFLAMDKDGDGEISRDEFPGNDAFFQQIDADKDGVITRREYDASPAGKDAEPSELAKPKSDKPEGDKPSEDPKPLPKA
jgi:Ca2+-binding EF-hand superfamily protein